MAVRFSYNYFYLFFTILVLLSGCKNPLSEESASSIESGYRPGVKLAAQLEFTTHPVSSINGLTLGAFPAVVVKDIKNNIVTDYSLPVILSVTSGSPAGTLSGTVSVVPTNGIAIFDNISIDQAGSNYSLTASTLDIAVVSNTFDVVSYKPSSVSISSNIPLEYYTVDYSSTITQIETTADATGAGTNPTGGNDGSTAGSGAASTGSGIAAPLAGSYSGTGYATINAETGFTATITVSSTFPSGATGSCNVLSPYSSITCLLTNFNITGTQLGSTSGAFTLRAIASNGGPLDYLDSSSIPVKRKVIEKFMVAPFTGGFADSWGYYDSSLVSATVGGKLYFIGNSSYGTQKLFVYDGTTIKQLPNTTGDLMYDDYPMFLTVFNGKVYFIAQDETLHTRLFVTDGTSVTKVSYTSGATSPSGDFTGGAFAAMYRPIVANNKLFISLLNTTTSIRKLFSVDTSGNLAQVADLRGAGFTDNPTYMSSYGGNLYFVAPNMGNYRKVYKTDGSAFSTVSNTRASVIASDIPVYTYASSDGVYFWAQDAGAKYRLYKTNGTTVTQITNNYSGGDRPTLIDGMFANIGSTLYFWAHNANGQPKLFKYDGTNLSQISNSSADQTFMDSVNELYTVGENLYFVSQYTG
ncbi:MAG: hypothetical protein B7Y39_15575, partial [Bdellovibrio sp. 28-41-41]